MLKVIEQIVILGLLAITGFIAGRTNYLPSEAGLVLSKIVVKITLPALIITTMTGYDFSSKEIADGIWVYVFGLVFIFLPFLIGKFMSGRLKLQHSTANVYIMQTMFGNVVFLAFPLLTSLFGEKGLIYGIFFVLANDTMLWTLGVYLANRHNTSNWKDNLKHLVNGNTISFAIGITFVALNVHSFINKHEMASNAFNLFQSTFSPLGKTTTYLSMLFIGLILSEVRIESFSDIFKRYPIFILSFIKLLFIPLGVLAVLTSMGNFVDPFVKVIVVLQCSMPCGALVSALAAQYDSDYKFATESVFIATLLSILTIPFMIYILKTLNLI